ncbi:hypothetical protein [Klebsiella pneumoniae]|uniref:hypothetical protein n=1 Tax=Klebsiella pneumoniae TaxID=573 RepID=UPI001CA4BEF8|nr:hypothetical protein [Klebsiella pneumoniae]MBW6013047.1 hypothetical protein [Klebsiella pneumoniae]
MAKPDWGALQHQFLAEHAKTGISPKDWCAAQGLNYSSAKRYIKVTTYGANSQKKSANKSANSQKEKGGVSKNGKVKKNQPETGARSKSPETKPIRGSRTAPPTNAFQPGNQNALKHGGYGRRMLLSDAITEDAQMLTLDDELFWLRAASLTAAENIGRWQTELETADSEQAKDLHDLISQAQKAMHRNTARIESLEYTKAAIIKQRVDAAYREAATEKVELEIDVLKGGDKDNAIVVHNSLPIPGR